MQDNFKKLIVFFLWVYIIMRAVTVPITNDEAYSFLLIKTNYIKAMGGTANTHWLNSLGMKIGYTFLGHEPWKLRIFSVLSWLVYGYSAWRISGLIKNKVVGWGLFFGLILNPFLLDFFSLARGYGLACAFVLASLWKISEFLQQETQSPVKWKAALVFAILALFSNYTTLYYLMAVIAAFGLFCIIKKRWDILRQPKHLLWYFIVFGAGVAAIANLLFIKLYTGDLEYGASSNMIASVFGSLITGSLYFHSTPFLTNSLSYIMLVSTIASIGYAVFLFRRSKVVTTFTFLATVFFFILFLIIGFHIAFGTPYLETRTTLMIYPCFVTLFFFFLEMVTARSKKFSFLVSGISAIGIGLAIFVFAASANFKYCFEWRGQAETKQGLLALTQTNATNVLTHEWHYGILLNYYKVIDSTSYNFRAEQVYVRETEIVSESFYNKAKGCDYGLLLPPYSLNAMRARGLNFTVLKTYPITQSVLLKFNNETK